MALFRLVAARRSLLRDELSLLPVLVKERQSSRQPQRQIGNRSDMTSQEKNVELVTKVFELVKSHSLISGNYDRSDKVIDFVAPDQLGDHLGGLTIESEGLEDIQDLIEAVAKYSVKTCHPHFYNQLYHGSDAAGLAGQVMILFPFPVLFVISS